MPYKNKLVSKTNNGAKKAHPLPKLSTYYQSRQPSAVRLAQIEFNKRQEKIKAINTAVGNVTLSMHPAMQQRLKNLAKKDSPFANGVIEYAPNTGVSECINAFLNIIASSGFTTDNLQVLVTNGGSVAMELVVLGMCGLEEKQEKPLLLIDPAYSNYQSLCARVRRANISITRTLRNDGHFTLPDFSQIEKVIQEKKPGAILIIPYDNPTGQFFNQETINRFAKLAVKYNLWLISDEAYRELNYTGQPVSSIWGVSNQQVPGIEGRRVSIESASKVWNACGLRVGALVTDNKELHTQALAEFTANLGAGAIDQYIFAGLANEKHQNLKKWYEKQRNYYQQIITQTANGLKKELPEIIVSQPEASIYSVVDVKNLVSEDFNSKDFVMYCALQGKVVIDGQALTLLVAPMGGFYNVIKGQSNPGRTQMRIAYVETPDRIKLVPKLFASLFKQYLKQQEV